MGAKEYLEQLLDLDKKIDSKMRERKWIVRRADWYGLTEETELKLRKYDEDVNDYIDELLELEITVSEEIMQLEDYTHQMVLRERYMFGKKWQQIADEQHYDVATIHRLHNKALEEFEKVRLTYSKQNGGRC